MLLPRIIPCLLVRNGGLVKTVNFGKSKYVGDPINAVKIFNEKEVDELIVIDIDATVLNREPNYTMIEHLAAECRMPLCYGGGVKNPDQVRRIIQLGVEKVAISSKAIAEPYIIIKSAENVGNQSIVVVLDVKQSSKGIYEVWTHNARINTKYDFIELAQKMVDFGAGEILVNSIDNDGLMKGYDFKLIEKIINSVNIPITILGGAGSMHDLGSVIEKFGTIGVAAGSLFVFKGVYKAVLINYPHRDDKLALFGELFRS